MRCVRVHRRCVAGFDSGCRQVGVAAMKRATEQTGARWQRERNWVLAWHGFNEGKKNWLSLGFRAAAGSGWIFADLEKCTSLFTRREVWPNCTRAAVGVPRCKDSAAQSSLFRADSYVHQTFGFVRACVFGLWDGDEIHGAFFAYTCNKAFNVASSLRLVKYVFSVRKQSDSCNELLIVIPIALFRAD